MGFIWLDFVKGSNNLLFQTALLPRLEPARQGVRAGFSPIQEIIKPDEGLAGKGEVY